MLAFWTGPQQRGEGRGRGREGGVFLEAWKEQWPGASVEMETAQVADPSPHYSEAFAYSLGQLSKSFLSTPLGFAFNHLRAPCVLLAMQTVSYGDQDGSNAMPSGWEPASGHIPARNYVMST